jgi:ribosomal protein L29
MATAHLEHLSGSQQAKRRLAMILKTMLGEMTVAEACSELGIGESRFHALRNQWLQGALTLLEPRRVGRPPKHTESDATGQIARLEANLQQLQQQLQVAGVRREIAEILPHVRSRAGEPGKKMAARRHRH